MLLLPAVLSLVLSWVSAEVCRGSRCDPRPCAGARCPGSGSSRQSAPGGCADARCAAGAEPAQPRNDTSGCRGLECRLPPRVRPRRPCAGEGCPAAGSVSPPLFLSDRAAQVLGDFPEFGQPPSEHGGAPLGVQLVCDIKPGENEVPSEDALILHLQLVKGQEKLVEALRAQQVVVRDLQQKLADQQEALLSQQRDILQQQRHMYEQMDALKSQFGLLADTIKQVSFQGLQGELQSYFQSHLAGLQNQARSHLQKPYAVHKMDVASKGVEVMAEAHFPQMLSGCPAPCGPEEFCDFQGDVPQCEKCTMCPPGFFLISQCSPTSDTMCQDRDECLELPHICGERVKCVNTPGGFRCLGVPERKAAAGLCGHEYFYNTELQECQACSDCDGGPLAAPCTAVSDAVCGSHLDSRLSSSWMANVALPGPPVFPDLQLQIRGKASSEFLSSKGGKVIFLKHGLIWMDQNFAVKHRCRSFLQVGMRLNASHEEEARDISGIRIEQPEGKYYQGVSVSAGVEVEPNDVFTLLLWSPNQLCNQSKDLQVFDFTAPSFSLLWLSHDTGAVAMTAQMSLLAHHQTSYRPTFRIASVSDPYMIGLTHDARGIRFTESGVVKFVLQQALYAMGHTCVREGFTLIAYTTRNGSGLEAMQGFKTGVNYRDTSITLSGAVRVENRDMLTFEIVSPSQCSVRYFGDSSGISMLSLIWIPAHVSAALRATVLRSAFPFGAVRNKPLLFQQVSPDSSQVQLARSGDSSRKKNFVFEKEGTANVALDLKLIHSCNIVKVTLHRVESRGSQAGPVAQQVSGSMPEGSEWAHIGLRASFQVQNGTAVFVTLDCIRGRVNRVSHEGGANISILWVAP